MKPGLAEVTTEHLKAIFRLITQAEAILRILLRCLTAIFEKVRYDCGKILNMPDLED